YSSILRTGRPYARIYNLLTLVYCTTTMKPAQVTETLKAGLTHNFPLLITGAPGIGKSDVTDQAFAALNMPYDLRHPVIEDSTDVKGMPGFDGNLAKFFP